MKGLVLFPLILIGFSLSAQFEDYVEESYEINKVKSGPKFIFKTNPLSLISGEIPLLTSEYRGLLEYVPDYKSSYTAGISFYTMGPILKAAFEQDSSMKGSGFTVQDFALLGYRAQLGYRIYPQGMGSKNAIDGTFPPKGFFLFGLVSYSDARLFLRSNRSNQIQFSHFNITANTGYQFVIDDVFTIEVYLGAGYKKNQINEISRTNSRSISNQLGEESFIYDNNLKINFGFNFGIIL